MAWEWWVLWTFVRVAKVCLVGSGLFRARLAGGVFVGDPAKSTPCAVLCFAGLRRIHDARAILQHATAKLGTFCRQQVWYMC